jgi:hypothetical protein
VIISYKDFLTQANAWADYRRGQGISVEVVNVDDIYDEFNFGTLSARSLRDFLDYARQNWITPPQYVLLLGDGSNDPRNYQGLGSFDLVPVPIVGTIFGETGSDDAIVDFNDDGLAEMAIGRIPARTADVVTNALGKVQSFEQPAMQTLSRGNLFAYDTNVGYDFNAISHNLASQLPVGTSTTFFYRGDAGSTDALIAAINTGPYMVNWTGHGATGVWGNSPYILQNSNVPQLTNANSLSIFTSLSCLNGYFLNPNGDSIGELLLKSTAGGAVAVWASSGETTADIQEQMGGRFFNQIGQGDIKRLGDLIVDAKTQVVGGTDVRLSWVLLGDPMLKVRQ